MFAGLGTEQKVEIIFRAFPGSSLFCLFLGDRNDWVDADRLLRVNDSHGFLSVLRQYTQGFAFPCD
jgi:hypothetical protein